MGNKASEKSYFDQDEVVIILGSYINACSLATLLQEISYQNPIILLETATEKVCLADIIMKNVIVVKKVLDHPDEIISLINDVVASSSKKIIMFTDERYMEAVKRAIDAGTLENTRAFTGAGIGNDVLLDRTKFYSFVERLGGISCPKTISSDEDPFEAFGDSFIVRPKESWNETGVKRSKHLRVTIVNGKQEFEDTIKFYRSYGLTQEMWCYQELLNVGAQQAFVVCGWYDRTFKQYAVSRRIMSHPPRTGTWDVSEIVTEYPSEIIQETDKLLSAMDYSGPFELEYDYDQKSGEYKVIELNPRFWLQHTLVNKLTNYSLIRRYLGEENLTSIPWNKLEHKYWISGTRALYYIASGKFGIFKYMKNGYICPSISQSVKWALHYRKYKKSLQGN